VEDRLLYNNTDTYIQTHIHTHTHGTERNPKMKKVRRSNVGYCPQIREWC